MSRLVIETRMLAGVVFTSNLYVGTAETVIQSTRSKLARIFMILGGPGQALCAPGRDDSQSDTGKVQVKHELT